MILKLCKDCNGSQLSEQGMTTFISAIEQKG